MNAHGSQPPWPMSRSNLAKLENKKYRQRWGLYLLDGTATIRDAHQAGARFHGILVDERYHNHDEETALVQALRGAGVPVQEVTEPELSHISGLITPPPLLGVVLEEQAYLPEIPVVTPLVLALDRVQDPGNAGTLLRSAAFYGVKEVWFGKGTVERYNPKVLRAAMSAHFHLKIAVNVDLESEVRRARESGCHVYVADMRGEEQAIAPDASRPAILILGNEPNGVDPVLLTLADTRLAIARRGRIDSLNVAMAGTVLLDRLYAGRNM
ncbi:MAG: RNA methyltransferase [bacterium]